MDGEKISLDDDEEKILVALNPRVECDSGRHNLILDIENYKKVLSDLRVKGEQVILQSELLGLKCSFKSTIKDINDLKVLAENSMEFMKKEIGSHTVVRSPMGIG